MSDRWGPGSRGRRSSTKNSCSLGKASTSSPVSAWMRASASGDVATRRFEAVEPGVAPKTAQLGPALNRAANDVAKQVADWMAS